MLPSAHGAPEDTGRARQRPYVELVGLFLEAHRGLLARLTTIHRAHGLQGSEFTCLLRLSRTPGQRLRMTDLAAQTGTSTSGITSIVERLLAQGLVARDADPGDRRSLVVRLTEVGGERLSADLGQLIPVLHGTIQAPLGSDHDSFTQALRRLRDVLNPNAAQRTP